MIELKINIPMMGKKAGDTVKCKTKSGVIVDRFWRNRLGDAKIDNCVEIVDNKKIKTKEQS